LTARADAAPGPPSGAVNSAPRGKLGFRPFSALAHPARELLGHATMSAKVANGKAFKNASTFRMECGVHINIRATPKRIWSLLTDAPAFPRWNSTVTKLDGEIKEGQKLRLEVTSAPGRVFRPKVASLAPMQQMVWSDGAAPFFRGVRTFRLTPKADGTTDFSMEEVLSGAMLPMIKGSLPDFAPPFERYAADLKEEAEKGSK
jgi:hypothetical protein